MFTEIFLYAFTSLFVIVDPIGTSLVYLGITSHIPKRKAQFMAVKGILIAFVLLLLFGQYGESLLSQLGITTSAFRIAGGIFLFTTAFKMVTSQPKVGEKDAIQTQGTDRTDYSVYPLAIPLLAGPGCMTTIILLMSNANGDPTYQFASFAALAAVQAIALVCLLFSNELKDLLGKTGAGILTRVFGILLAALSVQFIVDGISTIFEIS